MGPYVNFVTGFPYLSAVIQFAILGTLGEYVSNRLRKDGKPFTVKTAAGKAMVWMILAVAIKTAFIGFDGFVAALVLNGVLPESFYNNEVLNAATKSVSMNLQFGPFMVLFHRLLDNLVSGEKNWKNLDKALLSLFWFWMPVHTVTFILPKVYQIGLAAVWSFVLGLLLSTFAGKKASQE